MNLDVVTLDIETSDLEADFSVLLCAVIKPWHQEPVVFRADQYNPEWDSKRHDDKALVGAVRNELIKHAVVITHYGSRFDLPYLRAKVARHGMEPLPLMFGLDTWAISRGEFKVSSRRLANLVRYFGLGEKSPVDGEQWNKAAMDGDIKALDAIVKHNIVDCEVLERLAEICWPYARSLRKM